MVIDSIGFDIWHCRRRSRMPRIIVAAVAASGCCGDLNLERV